MRDEIGQLADSFNRMTEDLKKTTVSKEYVDSIIKSMIDTLLVVDPEGRIRTINPATAKLLGYKEEELIGKPVDSIFEEEELIFKGTKLEKLLKEGSVRDYDMTYLTKSGGKIPVSFSGSVMKKIDCPGKSPAEDCPDFQERGVHCEKIIGIVGIARDMREIKNLISQLEDKTEELETFVYTVSHDLKAPLVSLEGFSGILLEENQDKLDEKAKHYLERIQANTSQMGKLIADLLEISRIGRLVGPEETIDIGGIVEEMKELFASQLDSNQIKLHVEDGFPRIKGDRERIKEVYQNLISNAISYIGEQKDPEIEAGYGSSDDKLLKLYVKDNGIGIAKPYHEQIFNIFNRLKEIDTPGTGVGLTIVKRIVEYHGGNIWVESEKGKGTTFWFTLPKA